MSTSKTEIGKFLSTHPIIAFFGVAGLVFVIWLVFPLFIRTCIQSNTVDYGNTHGAVNSLFAGLAFAGVIIAILLQREELELQRTVLEEQRLQMESQAKSLRKQTFEQTFLELLRIAREVRDEAECSGNATIPGVNPKRFTAIFKMAHELRYSIVTSPPDKVSEIYGKFEKKYQEFLPQFIGIMSDILVCVDTADIDDKPMYIRVFRTLFRGGEQDILFYHFCHRDGATKTLIEKYGVLAFLSHGIPMEHRALYKSSAFDFNIKDERE